MKQNRTRKCLHCHQIFHPDVRNRRHQRYCSAKDCRRASKAASQYRWLHKPENRDYFKGPANVQRVQAWRAAHPGYSKRAAPQDRSALQDLFSAQPLVLIGLIAHLTNTALQDAMPNSA